MANKAMPAAKKSEAMHGFSRSCGSYRHNNRQAPNMPSRSVHAHHDVATAVTSTSILNSGRVKPDTITRVEAKALPDT